MNAIAVSAPSEARSVTWFERWFMAAKAAAAFSGLLLAACGGGDNQASFVGAQAGSGLSPGSGLGYVAGVYMPATQFEGLCAAPRPGNPEDHPGSTLQEKLWMRSWINDTYLWYGEVADTNPGSMTPLDYFDLLKTNALTPSGRLKDRFHFTYDTAAWEALSQSGVEYGYGAEWLVLAGAPPRRVVVAFTHPNEPASRLPMPLQRGEEVIAVDGIGIDSGSPDALNEAFWPSTAGQSHSFTLRSPANITRTVTMTSETVTLASVQNVLTISSGGTLVGYMQFNDHLAQSERALSDAFRQLQTAGVTDLIIDMRYNGGGYLAIAAELGYMIAGSASSGRTFDQAVFNDKYPNSNPITGQPNTPIPFLSTANNFSLPSGTPLPTLNLSRVFILTGSGTCSASESLINGLRGIGITVIQVGSTTCGKPYGFYGTDNCGTTFFAIQMRATNAVGFGDYADGFVPANTAGIPVNTPVQSIVQGCSVRDDFLHVLGDPAEERLAAALAYRASGTCPAASGLAPKRLTLGTPGGASKGAMGELRGKSILRQNSWN